MIDRDRDVLIEESPETDLRRDRIATVLVVVGMIALFGLIIWIATMPQSRSGSSPDE